MCMIIFLSKARHRIILSNSIVFESILLNVYNNHYKHQSYVIGSIYRRPSELIADLTQFTE